MVDVGAMVLEELALGLPRLECLVGPHPLTFILVLGLLEILQPVD